MGTRSLYVPNGLFFVHDVKPLSLPEFEDGPFYLNYDCIAVRAMHEQEGRCKVTLEAMERLPKLRRPDLVRPIRTRCRRILLTLVPGNGVMATDVATDVTFVSIWTNDPIQPDEVIIGIGGGVVAAG